MFNVHSHFSPFALDHARNTLPTKRIHLCLCPSSPESDQPFAAIGRQFVQELALVVLL